MVIAEIGQPDMAKAWTEVQLDCLAVAGQRAGLQLGLRLPPAQPPRQVLAERGPPVVDVRALADPGQHFQQGVLARLLGRVRADPRTPTTLIGTGRRLIAGIPAAMPT